MTINVKKIFSAVLTATIVLSLFVMPVAEAGNSDGWEFMYCGDVDALIEIDETDAFNGRAAMKAVNHSPAIGNVYAMVVTRVDLKAGKPYIVSMQVKSEKSKILKAMFDWTNPQNLTQFGGTFDWTNFEWVFIPTETKSYEFELIIEGETDGIWIDDVKVVDEETGENLIINSGFESESSEPAVSEDMIDDSVEELYQKIMTSDSYTEEEMLKIRGAFQYMPVYKADGITIDGSSGDWEGFPAMTVPTLPTQYMVYMDDGRRKDNVSEVRCAYDEENFYFYIEVEDDIFTSYSTEDTYWQGDSIQMAISSTEEEYGSELGFSYNSETGVGTIFGNGFTAEQKAKMELKAYQDGTLTIYEASIPWKVKFEERPSQIYLNYLVNDNDGDGRRYCAELAPKGISEYKTNKDCPLLEMQDSKRTWYGWIQGPRECYAGDEVSFDGFLINSSDEEKVFDVSGDFLDLKEVYKVPAHSGIRFQIKKSWDTEGQQTADIKFSADGEEMISSKGITVHEKPPTVEDAMAIKSRIEAKTNEIKKLLDKCEDKGISTDYELLYWRVMDRFVQYTQEDIDTNDLSRVYYTEECLNELYEESKANLNAYLNGEKKPFEVPRYITSDITVKDRAMYALNEFNGEIVQRPTFFVGYGHFETARNDIPIFNEFGANTIQQEIGPSQALLKGTGWGSDGTGGGTVQTVTDDVKDGEKALMLSYSKEVTPHVFSSIYKIIGGIEGGKTYELKGWVKATDVNAAWLSVYNWDERISLDGTYDWKEISARYVAPKDATETVLRINTDGPAKELLLDGFTFKEVNSDENLLTDGSFEDYDSNIWTLNMRAGSSLDNYCKMLETAEKNNITVSVLISPHYFFDAITNEYNIGMKGGVFNFNINAPIAREILEQYVKQIIPILAKYKSVSNICLTNEPQIFTDAVADNFYLEPWREFLKETYGGDINKLNSLWNTNYTSFDECDFNGYKENPVKFYDYKIFNDKALADFHIWFANLVRELAPGIPIHAKIMNYIGDGPRGNSNNGTNYLYNHEAFDINGCDANNYIDDTREGVHEKNIWYDYMMSYKDGPVINSEDHISTDRNVDYRRDAADYMAQDIYQGGIHGRCMSQIWVWERYKQGGSTDFIGSVLYRPDAIAKIGKATLDLNRLAYEIVALQNEIPEVGIVYSDADIVLNPETVKASYEAYEAALYNGKTVRFITDLNPSALHNYKLVVVPNSRHVSPEIMNELSRYIANGGKVIVMGKDDDILSMDKRSNAHDRNVVDHIKNNSVVIDYKGTGSRVIGIQPPEICKAIRDELIHAGAYYISVMDVATGEPAYGIEYNIGVKDDKVIVNLSNAEETKDVKLYLGDKPVTKSIELRSGEELGEVITSEKYVPITLEIETDYVFFDAYGHWAEEYIAKLHKDGVISGRSESRYDPDGTITRWEFHALVSRAAGKTLPEYNPDSEAFRPNDKITREEMCKMLVNYYEAVNGQIDANVQLSFTDEVSDIESVSKAVFAGLMLGREDGTFDGNGTATRGEAATVIFKFRYGD